MLISGVLYAKNDKAEDKQNIEFTGFLNKLSELKEISEVMDMIALYFVGEKEVDKEKLLGAAIEGMIRSLDDPHTNYFKKEEMEKFTEDIKGEYAGVGMVITKKEGYLTVVSPIEGTPAYKAGMKPSDTILAIEKESTFDLTTDQCVDRLKGEADTKVKITVKRKNIKAPFEVILKRAIIKLKYVKYEMLENNVGYLRLTQFSENVAIDVRKALEDLQSQGMKSLIFDLRNNPGGSLKEAVEISSFFLDKSPIVTIRGKIEKEKEYDRTGKYFGDFPLAILVNEGSASASEIVAGAIKDHKRGILIGEKTFGKGSVQNLIPLPDGDGIKLTIAKYYTPSGVCIHGKGIEPDVKVEENDDYMFFDGYITNVDDTESKEEKKELIKEVITEKKGEKEAEKIVNKKDIQLETAKNVLKGIMFYKK